MEPLTPAQVRQSFVNCTKGEVQRMNLPSELAQTRWSEIDLLGWRDPRSPGTAYLVVPGDMVDAAEPVGILLRVAANAGAAGRKNMCTLCLTTHSASDMALMVAPVAGPAGRNGNTVGTYICADLACSRYARGLTRPNRAQPVETLTTEQKVARLRVNVAAFVRRVLRPAA